MDRRVPARLAHDEVEVVVRRQLHGSVATPAELDGLPLHGVARHPVELLRHQAGEARTELLLVVPEGAGGEEGQGVAGVDRQGHADLRVEGRRAAAQLAVVLDVVVDEERVVEHLDGGRRRERVVELAAERDARRQAQAGTDRLAAATGVVGHEVPELGSGLLVGQVPRGALRPRGRRSEPARPGPTARRGRWSRHDLHDDGEDDLGEAFGQEVPVVGARLRRGPGPRR